MQVLAWPSVLPTSDCGEDLRTFLLCPCFPANIVSLLSVPQMIRPVFLHPFSSATLLNCLDVSPESSLDPLDARCCSSLDLPSGSGRRRRRRGVALSSLQGNPALAFITFATPDCSLLVANSPTDQSPTPGLSSLPSQSCGSSLPGSADSSLPPVMGSQQQRSSSLFPRSAHPTTELYSDSAGGGAIWSL